jgi:hypothetical protein
VHRVIVLVILALAPSTAAWAQVPSVSVSPGQRVRVTYVCADGVRGCSTVGLLARWDADSVVVTGGHDDALMAARPWRVAVPRSAVTALAASQGRHSHVAMGLAVGLLVGTAAGGVWAVATPCKGFACLGDGYEWFAGVLLGTFGGALIGAGTKSESWAEVPVERISLHLLPRGRPGMQFGLTLSF